ncbi:MAG: ABC transporter permease [Bacillota bacterium]
MLGRLHRLISRDLLHIARENILIYVVVVPLVMALAVRLMVPSLESAEITAVVDPSITEFEETQLEEYFRVERVSRPRELRARVRDLDDVVGFARADDEISLVAEGNEPAYLLQIASSVPDIMAAGGTSLQFERVQSGGEGFPTAEYAAILLIVLCISVGGFVMGLSIVDDRESRYIEALAVTPLRAAEYLSARALLGSSIAFILGMGVVAIVLGPAVLGRGGVVLGMASSMTLTIAFGYILGIFSSSQLGAIALTKAVALPYTLIPIAAIFLPDRWLPVLYPFPNYWSFESLRRALSVSEAPVWWPALLTVGLGAVMVAALWRRALHNWRL